MIFDCVGWWWGGSRSLDTNRNQVGKTDSPRTVGSPRAGWHVSGDVSHRCEVSGVHRPRSWRSTDVIACCRCSSDARHNTDLALLPLPASTRPLTGEMKPDAQFPETRWQREIKLRGLDRQELAPIVAEAIRRAVVKRRGRDRRGLTDHGRNETLGEGNYSPTSQNKLACQLIKSSHCHCQVARTTLARAKQSTDQRTRCDTERAGKKSNEKINKHKLILTAAADLHKEHTTRYRNPWRTHQPQLIIQNNEKVRNKNLKTAEQNTHGLLGAWSLTQ